VRLLPWIIAIVLALALAAAVLFGGRAAVPVEPPSRPLPLAPRHDEARPTKDPVAVAAAFVTSFTPSILLDATQRTALVDRWADPVDRQSLQRAYAAEADRVRATYGGAPAVARSALLGYRIAKQDGPTLDVSIWAVGLAAGRIGTGASGWTTVTVTLRAHGSAWRVARITAAAGPAPGSSARALTRASDAFLPFSHAR
jgi:hypothetical protein